MKAVSSISRGNKQSGAVSLFVVIFAMLVITVITVSFVRLMMVDQQQASENDLSQSAYDSAQAGVEDAKRALLRYQQICSTNPSSCNGLRQDLSSAECNAGVTVGGIAVAEPSPAGSTGEVKVQQSGTDENLQQAYTCVLMQLATNDYIGDLAAGESQLVPLVGEVDGGRRFDTVTIRWFSREDVSSTDGSVTLPGIAATRPLPTQASWGANKPPVMRAQLVQIGASFTMESFDTVAAGGGATQSNANTVFLFPTSAAAANNDSFTALDNRKNSPADDPDPDIANRTPRSVQCRATFASVDYSCSMSLTLPEPMGGGTDRTAFLRLTPYYAGTHFQVVLSEGVPTTGLNNIVRFRDVQPVIDSTGRADNMFRRVESRVNLYNTNFPYPDATIDITGNFCKNFAVSDDPNTYASTVTSCAP